MTDDLPGGEGFSRSFYIHTVRRLLLKPGDFFGGLPERPGLRQPLLFLLTSSFILAALRTPFVPGGSIPMAFIILVNALAMPFIGAAIAYGLMALTVKGRGSWPKVLAVYAYASGLTHLVSWLPLATWVGEPWRWVLVGIGLVRGFGLARTGAAGVVAGSVLVIILLFHLLSSAFHAARGLV